MTIYSFWIFDRHCNCIYNREYTQVPNPSSNSTSTPPQSGTINSKDNEDNAKLLYGTLLTLRNLSLKLGTISNIIKSYATTNYRAHYFETASGLKFVALSDLKVVDLQRELKFVYEKIYIDWVVRNPLCPVDFKNGQKISNNGFIKGIDRFFGTL